MIKQRNSHTRTKIGFVTFIASTCINKNLKFLRHSLQCLVQNYRSLHLIYIQLSMSKFLQFLKKVLKILASNSWQFAWNNDIIYTYIIFGNNWKLVLCLIMASVTDEKMLLHKFHIIESVSLKNAAYIISCWNLLRLK